MCVSTHLAFCVAVSLSLQLCRAPIGVFPLALGTPFSLMNYTETNATVLADTVRLRCDVLLANAPIASIVPTPGRAVFALVTRDYLATLLARDLRHNRRNRSSS